MLGIVGRNGAGKSTLLKVLSRVTEPTRGEVAVRGRVGSLLEVGTGFHPELTGRENIYMNGAILGMKRAEIERKFDEIVAFSEVEQFIDTPVKRYSSGMYLRLAFAVAAHLEPEILVVDEVLAVGDAEFQKKCLGKMGDVAQQGRTVLFVSHNMSAILRLTQETIVLKKGRLIKRAPTQEAVDFYLASGQAETGETVVGTGRDPEQRRPVSARSRCGSRIGRGGSWIRSAPRSHSLSNGNTLWMRRSLVCAWASISARCGASTSSRHLMWMTREQYEQFGSRAAGPLRQPLQHCRRTSSTRVATRWA